MTKKDLIRLLIKLMGVLVLLNSLPALIGQFAFVAGSDDGKLILWPILILITTLALSALLIFCPDSIIRFLRLDKGFDDNQIKLDQLKSEKLISIAVLIIGGMFIVHSLAPLIIEFGQKIYASVAEKDPFFPSFENADNTRLYTNILQVLLGFFLITNYQRITHFLAKKNTDNE